MLRNLTAVVCLSVPLIAHAVQLQEIQDSSCGQWTKVQAAGNSVLGAQFQGWVMGFLSGWAWSHPKSDPLLNRDAAGMLGWIDNYCKANPLDSIAVASERLAMELQAHSRSGHKK